MKCWMQEWRDLDRLVIDNDDMDSNTLTESDLSLKSRSFLHRVNDRVRKILDQSSNDAMQDSNKHSLIWGMFMSSTVEASIFMGKNYWSVNTLARSGTLPRPSTLLSLVDSSQNKTGCARARPKTMGNRSWSLYDCGQLVFFVLPRFQEKTSFPNTKNSKQRYAMVAFNWSFTYRHSCGRSRPTSI